MEDKPNNLNILTEESQSDNNEDSQEPKLMGSENKYDEICPDCHGSGSVVNSDTCSSCNGKGVI